MIRIEEEYPKRMEKYDVIIVGGGPAGLECARELSHSDLRILLLEKQEGFGDKLCAGGLTSKDMGVLPLPDHVIEHRILRTAIHARKRTAGTITPTARLFTVNRKDLGDYQAGLLNGTAVEVRTRSQVTEIRDEMVVLKDGTVYGFEYLVGAEGYNSVVRRHLGLKVKKTLIGFQYSIRDAIEDPTLELFMDARRFSLWYAWIFPHKESIAVGCCCDPKKMNPKQLKEGFHNWMKERNLDPRGARLESCPISYDYRGVKFGNVFLAGEAAGLASGFTGEGIYQSLVSGQEVARMILDPDHDPVRLKEVLKYNRILERVMNLFYRAGPLRGSLQELLLILMNREWLRKRINEQFTSEA